LVRQSGDQIVLDRMIGLMHQYARTWLIMMRWQQWWGTRVSGSNWTACESPEQEWE